MFPLFYNKGDIMSESSIIDNTSFWTLDVAQQKTVRDLFDNTYLSSARLAMDYRPLFKQQKSLSAPLDYSSHRLDKINPASFKYMYPYQKKELEQELLFAFYIFSAKYKLDEAEHRRQGLPGRKEQIKQCAKLINELRKSTQEKTCETLLAEATNDDSEKPQSE